VSYLKMNIQEIPIDEVLLLRQRVLWPSQNLDFVKTPQDAQGFHFGLKRNDKWASCISLFITENTAQFRKFATLPDYQGKGYGSQLLHHSFEFLKQKGVKKVTCSARFEKQEFYSKFGMKVEGEGHLKNGLLYIQMAKQLD
jgi:predicted GNAT family N-acyltransferase